MPENKLGLIIFLFIILLIGIVLLDTLGDTVYENTNLFGATNESITMTGTGGALTGTTSITSGIVGVSFFGNDTTDLTSVIDTTVNWTSTGDITLGNTTLTNYSDSTWDISYTAEGDLYVVDGTSRTLIRLLLIFFAIAIILAAVHGFNKMRENMF